MLGDFTFQNPTKLVFGKNALKELGGELSKYGSNVMLSYGGGSIKKNGIYEDIIDILEKAGKNVTDDGGVMSNPTMDRVLEGCKRAADNDIDIILAVGGGSVIDYAKAVSVCTYCSGDPWQRYYMDNEAVDNEIIPVGSVLTMVGTGSEMNGGSVITNTAQNLKIGPVFGVEAYPKFAILNPEFTMSLPKYQMVSGCFDIFNHLQEQYFSGFDDNTSDYISEGLMKSVIHSSLAAADDPLDYEARSNLMWSASWALNKLVAKGKGTDWMVHMIGQSIGAVTNAAHGMTLSGIACAYYHHIYKEGLAKFVRFAINVWGVDPAGKTDDEVALEGLEAMKNWMETIGTVMHISELGVSEDMFDAIADGTLQMGEGYKKLDRAEIIEILRESM